MKGKIISKKLAKKGKEAIKTSLEKTKKHVTKVAKTYGKQSNDPKSKKLRKYMNKRIKKVKLPKVRTKRVVLGEYKNNLFLGDAYRE